MYFISVGGWFIQPTTNNVLFDAIIHLHMLLLTHIIQIYLTKIKTAPLRFVPLSGRSQGKYQFSLYHCKGMPGTAAVHIFYNQASKLCSRKLVMNQVGVKL